MIQYIKNLLPRLQQFSKSLNQLVNFVDKPWIYIDEKGNRHTYIFQRDKSLIMSLNGAVKMGSWNYIATAESLLIDRGSDKILLKHGFLDKAVMVLRTDNNYDKPWMLIDEKEIPDLDVEKYLKKVLINHQGLKTINKAGTLYYFSDPQDIGFLNPNSEFYDEDLNIATFSFTIDSNKNYEIEDGRLINYYIDLKLNTDKGVVNSISKSGRLSVGDSVLINGRYADDGYYKFLNDSDERRGFTINNGKVSSIKEKSILLFIVVLIFIVGIIFIIIPYFNTENKIRTTTIGDTSTKMDSTTPAMFDTSSSKNLQTIPVDANLSTEKKDTLIPEKKIIQTKPSFTDGFLKSAHIYIGLSRNLILASEGKEDNSVTTTNGIGLMYNNKETNISGIIPNDVTYIFSPNSDMCYGISIYYDFNQMNDVINFMDNNFEAKDPPPGVRVNFFKAWMENKNGEVYLWKLFKTNKLFFLTMRLLQ